MRSAVRRFAMAGLVVLIVGVYVVLIGLYEDTVDGAPSGVLSDNAETAPESIATTAAEVFADRLDRDVDDADVELHDGEPETGGEEDSSSPCGSRVHRPPCTQAPGTLTSRSSPSGLDRAAGGLSNSG